MVVSLYLMVRGFRSFILFALVFSSPLLLVAPGAMAADCTPVAHAGAVEVESPAATLYVLSYGLLFDRVELWRETNGIPGLQTNQAMGCGAAADAFVAHTCRQVRTCYALPV